MSEDEQLDYGDDDDVVVPVTTTSEPPGAVVVLCNHDSHSEVYVVREPDVEFLASYAGIARGNDVVHTLSHALAGDDMPVCGTCCRKRDGCRHPTERQAPLVAATILGVVVPVHDVAIRADGDGRVRVLVGGVPHRVLGTINLLTSRQHQPSEPSRRERPRRQHRRGQRGRPYAGRHRVT